MSMTVTLHKLIGNPPRLGRVAERHGFPFCLPQGSDLAFCQGCVWNMRRWLFPRLLLGYRTAMAGLPSNRNQIIPYHSISNVQVAHSTAANGCRNGG